MSTGFFGDIEKIKYEGPDSTNPLAYRHYNPDEIILGKRMEDHLRFAVAYWHTFVWPGSDPFGGQTFERPWFDDTMKCCQAEGRCGFRTVHHPWRSLLLLPRCRCAPGRQEFCRKHQEPQRNRRLFCRRSRPTPASSCSGAPPTCSPTAATCRVLPPIRIRMCLPSRQRR